MAKKKRPIKTRRKRYSNKEIREKMKEDPFVENLNKTIAFVKRHTQILLVSAVIVVVVFIGTKAFMDYRAKQEVEANRLLFQAQSSVEKNELDKSMAALDELLTKYGGTQAALSGKVIRASVYCAQGKYDEAIQAYKDLLAEQQGVLALEINFSLANAYQSKGLYDEALRIYDGVQTGLPRTGVGFEVLEKLRCGKKTEEQVREERQIAAMKLKRRDGCFLDDGIGCSKREDGERATIMNMVDRITAENWEEPDLDEIISLLEWAYWHRDELKKIGKRAGEDLSKLTWGESARQFYELLN